MALTIATRGTPYHNTANTGLQAMTDGGTPAAGKLLAFCICNAGNANLSTARTGYGLTWTSLGGFGWNAARSTEVWLARSDGATSAAPDSTYAASTGRHMVMLEITGVNVNVADIRDCVREQSAGVWIASATAAAATSMSFSVATPLNAANRHVGLVEHVGNEVSTAQANYTALENTTGFNTPNSTLLTETSNDGARTTCGASWVTSSISGGVAFELIASIPSLVPQKKRFQHMLIR